MKTTRSSLVLARSDFGQQAGNDRLIVLHRSSTTSDDKSEANPPSSTPAFQTAALEHRISGHVLTAFPPSSNHVLPVGFPLCGHPIAKDPLISRN